MAINTLAICDDRCVPHNTPRNKGPHVIPGRLIKFNFDLDQFAPKRVRPRKKKNSPYINGDKLHLLSRITEKRFVHRKNELFSSFPLAANIYKASSDEFKIIKKKQKVKKSVLTLPNVPAPFPKSCTVSDMNDSEYFERNDNKAIKKKAPSENKKMRVRTKGFEVYDRDAKHIHLESSSTELIHKPYDGDCRTVLGRAGLRSSDKDDRSITAQDVWTVLRNINKFQFSTPARLSDDENIVMPKRNKAFSRRCNIRKGRRLIETRRTEEISYVANFKIKSNHSVSQSTSNDRVTVINKNEVQKHVTAGEKSMVKNQNLSKVANKSKNGVISYDKNQNKSRIGIKPMQRLQSMCRNRLDNSNKILHTVHERIPESTSTVRESIDSSNYFRSESDNVSSANGNNKFMHPTRIEQIILNNTGINNNSTKKDVIFADDSSPERGSKGITRMVINHDTSALLNRCDPQKRKPRLVTTMPSAAMMPKMTAADIKRRIAQIKFPLIILGRDELSSSVEVPEELPQFNGLDEHIWPFMMDWTKKSNEQKDRMYSNNVQQAKRFLPVERYNSNLKKVSNDVPVVKPKDKKVTYCDTLTKKKVDHKRTDENATPTTPKKSKPMRQFKDKMLKLLYKKPSVHDMEQCTEPVNDGEHIINKPTTGSPKLSKVDADNNIITAVNVNEDSKVLPKRTENILLTLSKGIHEMESSQKVIGPRHPWARAKWASDFIDNVMRKIKNGAYYSYESKRTFIEDVNNAVIKKFGNKLDASTCVDFYDVAVQTLSTLNINKIEPDTNFCQTDFKQLVANGFDPLIAIPGFDDTLPEFEIKTLNINQIAVKHCLTNVMVQFDVAVPDKSSNLTVEVKKSTSSSCVPLSTTDSLTKIFKCNTTILNAVLPAELCSVIPKVMRSIMDSDSSLTIQTSFTDSHMTISEISECDSIGPLVSVCPGNESDACIDDVTPSMEMVNNQWLYYPPNQYMCSLNNYCIAPLNNNNRPFAKTDPPTSWAAICPSPRLTLYKSRVLITIMNGRFSSIDITRRKSHRVSKEIVRKIKFTSSEYDILPQLCTKTVICCLVDPIQLRKLDCKEMNVTSINELSNQMLLKTSTCISLETYKAHESWSPRRLGDFTSLLQNMWNYCKFNIHFSMPYFSYVHPMHLTYNNNNLTVNMVIGDNKGTEKTVTVTVSKLEIDSIYSRFAKKKYLENGEKICTNDESPIKGNDCSQNSRSHKSLRKSQEKPRKRGYVKLYKKCKSTTSLYGERTCTSLSKISNLDDFFQALGSSKTLSSVFDGCPGQKVLSCVREMKSWIKDITPRQALLVLVLTNKKETPNLVRFRPVLLQGIAVNRITRATELDMEIEVIERENVKLTQYEGISYIPASEVNQDNLLEELCWIAKTTASDYQRPFDETSEKLLKSLLEKRKKLNPSYLRVMARYVGLGLLKTPNKNK